MLLDKYITMLGIVSIDPILIVQTCHDQAAVLAPGWGWRMIAYHWMRSIGARSCGSVSSLSGSVLPPEPSARPASWLALLGDLGFGVQFTLRSVVRTEIDGNH